MSLILILWSGLTIWSLHQYVRDRVLKLLLLLRTSSSWGGRSNSWCLRSTVSMPWSSQVRFTVSAFFSLILPKGDSSEDGSSLGSCFGTDGFFLGSLNDDEPSEVEEDGSGSGSGALGLSTFLGILKGFGSGLGSSTFFSLGLVSS